MSRPSELFPLFADVTTLKGVGKGSVEALKRLLGKHLPEAESVDNSEYNAQTKPQNIPRIKELLFHLPVSVIDRTISPPIMQLQSSQVVTLAVTVLEHIAPPPRSRTPYRVLVGNDSGEINLTFFKGDKNYLTRILPVGEDRLISGKIEMYGGYAQMPHPDTIARLIEWDKVAILEPIYPLTWGTTTKRIAGWVDQTLERTPDLPEWIEPSLIESKGWSRWKSSLEQLHHPKSQAIFDINHPARQRLAYDEILASQLALAMVRARTQKQQGVVIPKDLPLVLQMEESLPFKLTAGQKQVLDDIYSDMSGGHRMLRLLQGDVGSGKTIVALLAALAVIGQGMQAAIMAPTEILARQHHKGISGLLQQFLEIEVVLLTGSLSTAEKKTALAKIANGEASLVIGTHALFQQSVTFSNLGLVVIDEQHRFGVEQRMALADKGNKPHMLLMTATPIPRSLSMVMYGDLDSSSLSEKPAGRQDIVTRTIPLDRLNEVIEGVKRIVAKGEKIYWICPLVEESLDENGKPTDEDGKNISQASEERHKALQGIFGKRVGLVHGKMKADIRQEVMQGFLADEYDILVATTVIEVGVDVPDATIIIIENAEQFGLSQLHQLRGRVGRCDKPSSCVLLYGNRLSSIAKERLKIIRENNDGFLIAEEDLRLRGGGEVLGTRQSGEQGFKFVDFHEHRQLITTAYDDVKLILHRDPKLESERGKALRILLYLLEYDKGVKLIGGG